MSDSQSSKIITISYWSFTITDGALRMLVLLHFHSLGYSPLDLAVLFLLYELMGVITNLVGGWLGAKYGLKFTLFLGLSIQVLALVMLAFLPEQLAVGLSVIYVMTSQALSGIAKDLTKMSSKTAMKFIVGAGNSTALYKWVSLLTGSKNTLKGVGFFVGAFLLSVVGFQQALLLMAGMLIVVLVICYCILTGELGSFAGKVKFKEIFSKSREVNLLSGARIFLFASRDVWFVVGLPIFLVSELDWNFGQAGTFMAIWVIGYGIVQACVPLILSNIDGSVTAVQSVKKWGCVLSIIPILIAFGISGLVSPSIEPANWLIVGLFLFGIVFAINSALHSYLIVEYADIEKASLNIGFYYMANAIGRFMGTFLSGFLYQYFGLTACLFVSTLMIFMAVLLTLPLGLNREIK